MTDRAFSVTVENALDAQDTALSFLVYLNWPTGAVRVWSGEGAIVYGGQTWYGLGRLGAMQAITDSLDSSDIGIELTLNYLDDTLRNEINTQVVAGTAAEIYLAVMNVTTVTVTDAYRIFSGFTDQCVVEDAGESGALRIRLANQRARLQRPRFFTLSDAHQRFLFAGDRGCEFATRMSAPIAWGRKTAGVTVLTPGRPWANAALAHWALPPT